MSTKKKALMLASVASMIDQFNIPNVELLQSLGYYVDVIADFTNPGNISNERANELIKRLESMDVHVIDIAIPRSLNPKVVLSAYKEVKKLIISEHYNLVHCHSPIGGAITRLAAKNERKNGTRVIYTAHGFHFYDGAPLKNWIVFYPVEKWLSKFTDVLITINREDYKRAIEKFKAKKTFYVPGIGVDTEKFGKSNRENLNYILERAKKREELGIPEDAKLIISVGELSARKNHKVVVDALNEINDRNLYYIIVGKGKLKEVLEHLDMTNRLKLLGYRTDVVALLYSSDLFVFPSLQEGLPVALMEAMAAELPCVVSRIRGNTDLIENEDLMFNPTDFTTAKRTIKNALENDDIVAAGQENSLIIQDFSIETVREQMRNVYDEKY